MTDKGERYGLVRGFLLAHNAPAEVLEALESLGQAVVQISGSPIVTQAEVFSLLRPDAVPPNDEAGHGVRKQRKTRTWTPEQRAAASDRMRNRMAARGAVQGRQQVERDLGEAEAPLF